MKKLHDLSQAQGVSVGAGFGKPSFFISLFIGLISGYLATLPLLDWVLASLTKETIFMKVDKPYSPFLKSLPI